MPAPWLDAPVTRPCPLCGGTSHQPVSARMQHKLNLKTVICTGCGLVFTNPVPEADVYARFYVEAYADYYGHIVPTAKPDSASESTALKTLLDQIERCRPLRGARLLEVGPGKGAFLRGAKRRGAQVLGVEPSAAFGQVLAAAALPYIAATLEDIAPDTQPPFDVIVMFHVLEHFYDINRALQHTHLLLNDGGLLVLEVPNILKPFRSLEGYFLRYVHLASFSPATLDAVLQKHGFTLETCDDAGSDWRRPQNLRVIARKAAVQPTHPPQPAQPAAEVIAALAAYRRQWANDLRWRWAAHLAYARARRCVRPLLVRRAS